MSKYIIALATLLITSNLLATTTQQTKMLKLIDSVASVYESMYAPAIWKQQFAQWSLASEVEKAKNQISKRDNITTKEFHKILNALILSMKDYHTSISFYATESASLPFMIRGAEGRYFITYINRTELPRSSFPLEVGDEVLSMDGVAISEIVSEIKATLGANTDETDQAFAEMKVTSRTASKAMDIPSGPVTITFKKNNKVISHQLIWKYTKELLSQDKNNSETLAQKLDIQMYSPMAKEMADQADLANNFALGSKKSYLPALGTKIWESDSSSSFDAYIYLNEEKELVGYIRIPSYGAAEKESLEFKEIMKRFTKTTDKLVIDQLNNPGGSVFYLYSLVSMLSDKPMAAPRHYMAINQADIADSISMVQSLEAVKDEATLKKMFGAETIGGYPLSMNFLSFMKSYYQFKIDEWAAGKKLTSPYFLYGVDHINPHPEVNYTKPILILVNELDFSGGDFFPTIMQDNKRATIMGVRTAGAGGYVLETSIPNQLGVSTFRYTGSLADRVDHTPIENLGVTPEIHYAPTAKDYQSGFTPFKNKINEVIKTLK